MKNARWALMAAALIAAAPSRARAAAYELAAEWPSVSFQDGGRTLTLFLHMPDLDTPSLDRSGGGLEPFIPLYELSLQDTATRPNGQVASVMIATRVSPYRLMVRADPERRTHAVKREPDFKTDVAAEPVGFLKTFGLTAPSAESVLVVNKRLEAPAPPKDALSDIETAAVDSLDPSERTRWVAECGGGPGSPEALSCWRAKIATLLDGLKAEPVGEFSAFERRYMKLRLSPKSFEQFQRALDLSAGNPDKLALVRDWRDLVMKRDIDAEISAKAEAVAAKDAAKPAPPLPPAAAPAAKPVLPAAAIPARAGKKVPAAAVAASAPTALPAASARSAPVAIPAETPAPRRSKKWPLLALCGAIFVIWGAVRRFKRACSSASGRTRAS